MQYVAGIDEAGRGAFAGSLAVGGVLMPSDYIWQDVFKGIVRDHTRLRDSKKLTHEQREAVYERVVVDDALIYCVEQIPAATIDTEGITASVRSACARVAATLTRTQSAHFYLDAGLSVPEHYLQESHIKGDERFPVISLASIVAKVSRDRYMVQLDTAHPQYGFAGHKGYGTTLHIENLRTFGSSPEHRRLFLRKLKL
jgi:ribonuclease HII